MGAHAVHAEANHREVLATPIESSIKVSLLLPATINSARHIVQQMWSGQRHEGYAVRKLMPDAYRLVLIEMVWILWIVVPRNQCGKAHGFGQTIHTPLCVIIHFRHSFEHDVFSLFAHKSADGSLTFLVICDMLSGTQIDQGVVHNPRRRKRRSTYGALDRAALLDR